MSLSILKRPSGYYFDPTNIQIVACTNNNGKVNLGLTAHGLSNGGVIYVKSSVENYNGFFYVRLASADLFYIQSIEFPYTGNTADCVDFISVATEIVFYGTAGTTIKWNAVHLPIVYKISNDLWPVNSVDTVRTMSTVADSGGYCNITASGDIKATGSAAALEFVKVTGSTDSSLNKVWQIITYSSDTSFILNIPYSAANDTALTGASIQYYYNNYNVRVRVYGGFPPGHVYRLSKPYALLSELKLTPDTVNKSAFSIADILKSQIITDNNTLLGTLPNNINNWTGFYIEYAEAYDVATSSILVNTVSSYTSDQLSYQGLAINADLPFKNIYSGFMSEYISQDDNQKFLTLFSQPVKFTGKYFDIGFISNFFQNFLNQLLSTFTNNASGTAWVLGATPSVTLADNTSSQLLSRGFAQGFKSGITYRVAININYTGASTTVFTASIESAPNTNVNFVQTFLVNGANIFTVDLTAAGNYDYLVFRVVDVAGGGGGSYVLNNYWIYPLNDPAFAITEFNQGGLRTLVPSAGIGVYRVQLSEPSCSASSTDVTLYKKEILPLNPPGAWTDAVGVFDSKNFTQFTEAVTSATGTIESYMLFDAQAGEIVEISYTVVVSGTAVFSGSGIQVGFTLRDSGGGAAGAVTPFFINANGTYTNTMQVLCTITAARLSVIIVEGSGITSGTATVTITVGETITLLQVDPISETKTIKIDCSCAMPQSEGGMVLSWLNYLGGYDHWFFNTECEKQINVIETAKTDDNIFPSWPNSYGEFARGITRQTYRKAKNRIKLTSQNCTLEELKGLQYIRTAPVVTITNSIYDTRIITIDEESFTLYKQGDKVYSISFYAEFTDLIPSQKR